MEVKGPRTQRGRRQTEKEWEEEKEWRRSMAGLLMGVQRQVGAVERRLAAIEVGNAKVASTLNVVWGAVQALTGPVQSEADGDGDEDEEEEEEEETAETLREAGAESGNPEGAEEAGGSGDAEGQENVGGDVEMA